MHAAVYSRDHQGNPPLVPKIKYFLNLLGDEELLSGVYQIGVRDHCVLGVISGGKLCAIYDEERALVIIDEQDLRNVIRLSAFQVRQIPYGIVLPSHRVEVAHYTWRFPTMER